MKNKIWFAILATFLIIITVFAASAQPFAITSTPVTTATVGQLYTYTVTSNISGVTYGLTTEPTGMSMAPTTGIITWIPTTVGTFAVGVTAVESANSSNIKTQSFNVVVGQSSSKMLEITKVEAKVGGKGDSLTSPGSIDKSAKLGDDIELTVTVRNNFATNVDSTIIRNIQMDISSDLDDADGLDDSISRLEAGDHDEMTATFTLDPENVDPSDAPFDITINVDGKTSDGTVYTDSWNIKLDMDSNSRDLYIISAEASPLSFSSCRDNQVRVVSELRNVGSRDLDDAAMRLKISSLGINKIDSDLSLDTGDSYDFSDYVTIPKGVTAGTYLLEVDALPQRTVNTVTSDTAFEITVLKCETDVVVPENPNTNPNTGNNGGNVIIPDITVTGTPVATAVGNKGFFDSDNVLYLVFLGVLIVLLLVIIILVVSRLRD
jgi:hypothetical protein